MGDEDLRHFLEASRASNYTCSEITSLLPKKFPNYRAYSERTVKRMLNHWNIKRHNDVDDHTLLTAVQNVVNESSGQLGYRDVTEKLRSQGLFVSRDDVMNTLRLVDPQGVVMRTPKFKNKRPKKTFFSKGPNYLWSLDGHDKLSGDANCQFDLKIYGALDTYSRKIIFLYIGRSNRDSEVIGRILFDHLLESRVLPQMLRFDKGTETVHAAAVHKTLLQLKNVDKEITTILGPSTANKIERLWRQVREKVCDGFRHVLREIDQDGLYDSSCEYDRDLIAGVFIPVVERYLDEFRENHNNMRGRKQRNVELPSGTIPEHVYSCPEEYGGEECGIMLSDKDIESFTDADILSNVFTGIKINSELASEYLVAALPRIAELQLSGVKAEYTRIREAVYRDTRF
ncbi:uncharacterized protein LOC134815582 [Bolinopsis microptera]|uniref:uncharacterized protein LOC134815582 n=1 Tax=Bolinopsis microptera TaxID=2820187 RepID=UPI003079A443